MYKRILLPILLTLPTYTSAVLHPVLVDPKITSCSQDKNFPDRCSNVVYYSAAGLAMTDVLPLTQPVAAGSVTQLEALGIHCESGSSLTGKPFSKCRFTTDTIHAPTLVNCRLKSVKSWELKDPGACALSSLAWGGHGGAGPGGECVFFVQKGKLTTIYGTFSADSVANSGSSFCQKPLPPDVTCEINLPSIIDHGVIEPNAHSVVSISGSVDCGGKPVLTILGGGKVPLAPGVTTVLTSQMIETDFVVLTSTLDAINGTPGGHSASAVVIASPY